MNRQPPRATRTDPLLPYTTRFRSGDEDDNLVPDHGDRTRRHADGTGRGWAGQRHAGRAAGDDARPGRNLGLENDRAGGRVYRRPHGRDPAGDVRSEEHTSELQYLTRISYAVFSLKTKQTTPY